MHALGNCRFCPPRRQDAHCPILSPTLAATGARAVSQGARALGVPSVVAPEPWASGVQLRALLSGRIRRSQPVTLRFILIYDQTR